MFSGDDKLKIPKMTTIIGPESEITGNINFSGGLQVDGGIKGNVVSVDKSETVLTLNENGHIAGEIRVPNVILNGMVTGDVHAISRLELGTKAKINGNVHYGLLQMAMGAEVNGNLVHTKEEAPMLAYDKFSDDEKPNNATGKSSTNSDDVEENMT